MQSKLCAEARSYFKNHPLLMKLAVAFCKKYRSLGHFGGRLTLPPMTAAEQQELSAYLRQQAKPGDWLSYKNFALAWEKTRFASLPLEGFLLDLMPGNFSSKQEERQREKDARQNLYEKLAALHGKGAAHRWLEALKAKELHLYQRDFYLREELLGTVARALDMLPGTCLRLPIFASQVTGSPHGLDFDQEAGRLFLQALAYLKGETVPREADERTSLLYEFNILRDDILNFATACGLTAYDSQGQEIAYWRSAAESLAPLNLPFREIIRAHKIRPLQDSSPVYIVENSGVFSALLDSLQKCGQKTPLLALHGQLKAASWALLDKLAESGAAFLYSGDCDPEGLGIANRLLQKYPNARLWHMSAEEYRAASQPLPEERLKKLPEKLHPQLQPVAAAMRENKKVLYQESLLQEMERDLVTSAEDR
jgi:uncharacterized protein (TIGR02679 family)